jgi:hypothetical protein
LFLLSGHFGKELPPMTRSIRRLGTLLFPLAVALAATDCGTPVDANAPSIKLVTTDRVPNPLYEDDPGFTFNIYFQGEVKPAAGGISVKVVDDLGVVFKQLDKAVAPEKDGVSAGVNVVMPHVLPDLPAPGNVRMRIWDGASYEASTLRDEATVALVIRDPIESGGTAGGGLLKKGDSTIIWGVIPYIDPSDPGLIYEGSLDIWVMKNASANDTVQVEFGGWNGAQALNDQFANVYLRNATSGEFVAQVVKRTPGMSASVKVPEAGDYYVYVQHNAAEWADTAEYRITWP